MSDEAFSWVNRRHGLRVRCVGPKPPCPLVVGTAVRAFRGGVVSSVSVRPIGVPGVPPERCPDSGFVRPVRVPYVCDDDAVSVSSVVASRSRREVPLAATRLSKVQSEHCLGVGFRPVCSGVVTARVANPVPREVYCGLGVDCDSQDTVFDSGWSL